MNTKTGPTGTSRPSDNRYFPRWEVKNRVLYQLEQKADIMQGKTKDLSCAGACITVDEHIPKQKIKLTLFLNNNLSVVVEGNVVWNRDAYNDNVEIGVAFNELDPQAQELILQYAFEVNRSEVVNHWFDGWKNQE